MTYIWENKKIIIAGWITLGFFRVIDNDE